MLVFSSPILARQRPAVLSTPLAKTVTGPSGLRSGFQSNPLSIAGNIPESFSHKIIHRASPREEEGLDGIWLRLGGRLSSPALTKRIGLQLSYYRLLADRRRCVGLGRRGRGEKFSMKSKSTLLV